MMLIRKTSLGHNVRLKLSVSKIKEDFIGLENLEKVTLLEEGREQTHAMTRRM